MGYRDVGVATAEKAECIKLIWPGKRMIAPLISVVIPTCGRPQYLPRAVESALNFAGEHVEIIVVPNGQDESWNNSLAPWKNDARVRISPIVTANGNAARNHGMNLAAGKYLRFLDDDDYLLSGASEQLTYALFHNLDICSGNVALVSDDGITFKILSPPKNIDLVEGILSPERKTGLQFHLYRTEAIAEFRFREDIAIGQDTHWMHTLCRAKEWHWSIIEATVCTWVQHDSLGQISRRYSASDHLKLQERMLWETIVALNTSDRLTDTRRTMAAYGMWHLIHCGFFLSPRHWLPIIAKTQEFFPMTYPNIALYRNRYGKKIHPAVLESIMLPKRWMNHGYRQTLVKLGLRSQWQFSP